MRPVQGVLTQLETTAKDDRHPTETPELRKHFVDLVLHERLLFLRMYTNVQKLLYSVRTQEIKEYAFEQERKAESSPG
jgi:hypothetical protein